MPLRVSLCCSDARASVDEEDAGHCKSGYGSDDCAGVDAGREGMARGGRWAEFGWVGDLGAAGAAGLGEAGSHAVDVD